jgi:Zn-dependent peptidase ImmA (M78 family)
LTRPDDSSLTESQYKRVRKEAQKALEKANALGCFPTPVNQIMAIAQVSLAEEDILDESFLITIRKSVLHAGSALKRALSKVLGLFDARENLIFIDRSVKAVKQTFLKLHEIGHSLLPWQKPLYAVVEDCEKTLAPDTADQFDREANVFATEVLFQLDGFIAEANDHNFGIRVPLDLSKKYGSSVYAAVREYVRKNHRACAVFVLEKPEIIAGDGFRAKLRRVELSRTFKNILGLPSIPDFFTPSDEIGAMVPIGGRRMSSPRSIAIVDKNGELQECIAEAFSTGYNVFILVHWVQTLKKKHFLLSDAIGF